MTDQGSDKSPLSRRLQQQESAKRTAQNMQRIVDAQSRSAARTSGSIPTPKAEPQKETRTDDLPSVEALTSSTGQKTTAREIIETTSGLNQAKQLIAAGYKDEARQSIKRFLYRYSGNADAWWLYSQVPENDDQLYHILTALVNLPPNQYTAQAKAKLAHLPYRQSSKGNPLATQTGEWLGKQVTQQVAAYVGVLSQQTQSQPRVKKKLPVGVIAGAAVITILLGIFIGISRGSTSSATAPVPIPTVSAGSLFNYLLSVKLPISNLRSLPVPNSDWKGQQAFQFDVQQASDKGTFIVVSYDSQSDLAADAVKTRLTSRYKTWQVSEITNLLVLISPDTSLSVLNTVGSHLSQFAIAPYRSYIPTATPTSQS
jgi:hypothetical protein